MAILTREDSTNISLLLARPETEVRKWDRLPLGGARAGKRPQNAPVPFISVFTELEMSSPGGGGAAGYFR